MWKGDKDWTNPAQVLATACDRYDVVEGLIPDRGVTWMYGASMSYKTFVAMSIAAAASTASDWMDRRTEESAVVYVGAEGGMSLHARRAGAEVAAGAAGKLCVVTERPLLDTRMGQLRLRGILQGLTGGMFGDSPVFASQAEEDVFRAAEGAYTDEDDPLDFLSCFSVLVVVDTYSQTSGGDEKLNVGAYIKGLRDMIDDAFSDGAGMRLSFLVIDHATKAGGSYMGSVAKLNDVDSQLEVVRSGSSNRATLHHRKVKDGVESEPVSLELVPQPLEGYRDAYGKVITTLVARNGEKAAKIAEVADGKAGVILSLIEDEGGRCDDATLRRLFSAHRSNEGIKPESVARAYKRGKENLQEAGLTGADGDVVFVR